MATSTDMAKTLKVRPLDFEGYVYTLIRVIYHFFYNNLQYPYRHHVLSGLC